MVPSRAVSPLAVIACDPPAFSRREALAIAAEYYNLTAQASALLSERDQNFRLLAADGTRYVLKIGNAAEDAAVTDFQVQALLHLAGRPLPLAVPRIVRTVDGHSHFCLRAGDGAHWVRLVTYVAGEPLDASRLSAPLCRNLGASLAHVGYALSDFAHTGAAQSLLWDMQHAPALREVLQYISSASQKRLVADSLDDFEQRALPQFAALRTQVVHNDANPANVLVDPEHPERIAGLIDFGDMQSGPLVADLAIAASYLRSEQGEPLVWIAELVAGYHDIRPLLIEEVDLLYDLVNVRLATTVAILEWRSALRGVADRYLQAATASETGAGVFLARLRETPRRHVTQTLRQVCASVDLERSGAELP